MTHLPSHSGHETYSPSESRLLRRHAKTEQSKSHEQQPQAPVATDVTRSIMGTENPAEIAQRADAQFQYHMQRATETALVNLRHVAITEQAMFDTVKANDDMLASSAIQDFVHTRNKDLHTSGFHAGYINGEIKISSYKPQDPQLIQNRRDSLHRQLQDTQRLLKDYPNAPPPVMAIRRRKERDLQRELKKLDQQAAEPLSAPAGQIPQQPGAAMQGVNAAFDIPAGINGFEQAKSRFDTQQWLTAHPDTARDMEGMPPKFQELAVRIAESMNETDWPVLQGLIKKFENNPKMLLLSFFDQNLKLLTPEKIADTPAQNGQDNGDEQKAVTFLQNLSPQEQQMLKRLVRSERDVFEDETGANRQGPEQLTPAKRKTIEQMMDKYNAATTKKQKMMTEGNLRMMGVNVEESDFKTKKIQMLPEGALRLLAFIMGMIQVCSALFSKETAESKKGSEASEE